MILISQIVKHLPDPNESHAKNRTHFKLPLYLVTVCDQPIKRLNEGEFSQCDCLKFKLVELYDPVRGVYFEWAVI